MKRKQLLGAVLALIMAASSLNIVFSDETVTNSTESVVEESTASDSALEINLLDTEHENGWIFSNNYSESTTLTPIYSIDYNGHTYILYDDSLTWNEANEYCSSIGGYLATITSENEQSIIESLLENGNKKQYWIGLITTDESEWVTGEIFSYTNWDNGEPNNCIRFDGESEDYVHIYNTANPAVAGSERFKWNDMFYDNIYPGEEDNFGAETVGFICEIGNTSTYTTDDTIYTISFDYGADQLETKRNNHFATYSVYDGESGDTLINPAVSFYYSLFNGSSYDDYTKRIKQSICFAMATFNYYGDNSKGYLNANAFLSDLNFENIYHNDVYEQDTTYTADSDVDTIGLIAGSRTLTFDDGDYTLIALGVRGAGYGKEWAGNFRVDTGEEHEGFALARDQVIEFLNGYIREYGITGNIKLWITGYSRAAATTNLTAAYLDDGYGIDEDLDVVLTPDNIYAYCFETPAGTRTNTKNSALYDNIISVVNPVDFVPKVAFSDWNFGRYGITLYTATPSGTYDYDELYKKVKVTYNSITGQTAPDPMVQWDISSIIYGSKTQDIFLDEYLSCIAQNGIGSQDNYCSTFQDTVMPLLGVFLAGDESTKAELNELVDELLDKELLDELTTNLTDKSYLIELIIAKLVDELQEITKSTDLTESDVRKLLNALCNDYGTDLWALWANRDVIGFGHYPELCLSWILNSDEYYLGYGNSELSTRKVTVNCPVNVRVYDSKGKLVAEIVDDEVTNLSDVYISCYIDENEQKIIYLPGDEEFDVKITAADDGTMTYSVSEYDALNYSCEKIVNYYEVDISEGDTLYGVVENIDTDEGEYPLYYGDDVIEPSEILEDDEIEEYNVSLTAETGGSVYGSTSCSRGEYVKVCAYADDGYEFAGWYDENGLVSDESEYRFCVLGDVLLTAEFVKTSYTLGDVNGDGAINVLDLVKIFDYIQGADTLEEDYLKAADVNEDTYVNVLDLTALFDIIQG